MAVVFELVVNFANNESAVARANEICDDSAAPILVRGIDLALEGPYVTHFKNGVGDYIEFSVGVEGVRFGGGQSAIASELTDGEITTIGRQLYDLLRRFDGYAAAMVGWDPKEVVDLRALRSRIDDSGLGRLDGLVLATTVVLDWGLETEFLVLGRSDGLRGCPRECCPYAVLSERIARSEPQ